MKYDMIFNESKNMYINGTSLSNNGPYINVNIIILCGYAVMLSYSWIIT